MADFVHLHTHSMYSLLEATPRIKDLADRAKRFDQPALALTDRGNMFGAIEFYFACKDHGIKPIIGTELMLVDGARTARAEARELGYVVLLATDQAAYRNLCRLSSLAYQEGFYYKPRIDWEILEKYHEGLIILSGASNGLLRSEFRRDSDRSAAEWLLRLRGLAGDRFFVEMTRQNLADEQSFEEWVIPFAEKHKVDLVAAADVHFIDPQDQIAQEVLVCIGTNRTLHDPARARLGSADFFFAPTAVMLEKFRDHPEWLRKSVEIAEQCNVQFKLKDDSGKPIYHLPSFPCGDGKNISEVISELATSGLKYRLAAAEQRGELVASDEWERYSQRLQFELNVIHNMGFTGYFLIVQDFIGWAKRQGIPVGPGRGSGAGSLVAYSLGITDLDPMPYNLIFERFLNPERISMPDFDIDFCQENRGRVIEYVTEKYGRDSVSQIITFGRLQARAAIRDVGRVLGMTYPEVDRIAKLIPEKLGITLKEALEIEPRLREVTETDPQLSNLWELACQIEGLVRHAGIHAAGVIIADGAITQHAPLYRGVDGENVVQYDMKNSEKLGLIKFDFLGLKTLTHIQEALRLIQLNRGQVLTTADISLKDPGIYEIMSEGNTAGIFQFEGEGITDLIRKAQPNCFEDIVAINALYRPGPMEMIPDYIDRKHGRKKVEYLLPELEEVLKDTYGVIVYQEQVQLIAARIASYSLGEADMLRRAMGKKIASEMTAQRERFIAGATALGHPPHKVAELFDLMAEFANYGFNKSHAAAYCVVAAQTAYLKRYFPVEFFAALLSTEMSDTDKVVKYVKDAQRQGIAVRPPHVNVSDFKFSVKDREIYFSLGAIKGVGQGAVEAIIEARMQTANGRFSTLDEFFDQVDLRRVNKKTIEALTKAGALDDFGFHRAQIMAGFHLWLERAGRKRDEQMSGQVSLFSVSEELTREDRIVLPDVSPWGRMMRLAHEKEALGFFLSEHPLSGLEHLSSIWATATVRDLGTLNNKSKKQLLGLVVSVREIITRKGTRMAFCVFEDLSGSVELIVFPDVYAQFEHLIKPDEMVLLNAQIERDETQTKLIAESFELLNDRIGRVRKVHLRWDKGVGDLPKLKELLSSQPGSTPTVIDLCLTDLNIVAEVPLGTEHQVRLGRDFIEKLAHVIGGMDKLTFFENT